ncbi:hypothetical protein IPL85_01020 [Candidatus Saccharibacteria bacterium]|nr:MAG: hypothetical protein IPL85_01020 [Candidatus Saccharibacteria bacterium]
MPVTLYYDRYITTADYDAIYWGIEAVGRLLTRLGGLAFSRERLEGDLSTLPSGQVDAPGILDALPAWNGMGLTVVATGRDLGHPGMNYLFGQSSFARGKAIFSTCRLADNPAAISGLVTHELGHSFGLVRRDANNYARLSSFAGHCANPCIMRPANNKQEMLAGIAMMLLKPETSGFCGDCVTVLGNVHVA